MKKVISLFILLIFLTTTFDVIAQTVYVTKTGSKYHNDGCRYLSQSKISIDLSKLLPILRTTICLFLIDYNHSYDDVNLC